METKTAIIDLAPMVRNAREVAATKVNATSQTGSKSGSCDCGSDQETCCDLECLVQPRFFCGQLLSDADLNQFLDWAKAKFRLKRNFLGWGVVCGLEVSLDPQNPTNIIVHPGHAIDCCGRDLVACEPVSFDISGACSQEECLDVLPPAWNKLPTQNQLIKEKGGEVAAQQAFDTSSLFAGGSMFDLYLNYQATGTDPQIPLRRDSCGGTGACEPSRVREGFSLSLKEAPAAPDGDSAAKEWASQLEALENSYEGLMKMAQMKAKKGEPLQAWLLSILDRRPLDEFGFVRSWVEAASPDNLSADLSKILYFLRQDGLNSWMRCGCGSCKPADGVLIGRVWLSSANGLGSSSCKVLLVDDRLPYRRILHRDPCYPAPRGCINLAEYIWLPWETARDLLMSRGVRLDPQALAKVLYPPEWDQVLTKKIAHEYFFCEDKGTLAPVVVDFGSPFGQRVLGFNTYLP